MIRVLQVLDTLDACAGMTSVVVNYHRRIDRSRVQFDYLVFETGDASCQGEIEALGGRIYTIPRPGLSKLFFSQTEGFFSAHGKEYAAIHCHPIWAPGVFGHYARKYGIPHVIAHSHSTRFSDRPLSALRNRGMALMDKLWVDKYMACSEEAKELFYFVPRERVELLRNPVETERFRFDEARRRHARAGLGIGTDTVLVGHVGRFSPEKNHTFLLRVFSEFHRRQVDSRLILVGDGPLREETEAQIRALGLEDAVLLLGTRLDMENLYLAMDLLLLPSLFEGLPMVLLEAQAGGLPCLASDRVPRAADLSGLVHFEPLESEAGGWADWMEALLKGAPEAGRNGTDLTPFREKGYDLTSAAEYLTGYYEKLSEQP